MTAALWLLPALPLVTGGLLAAAGRPADRLAAPLAVTVVAVDVVLAVVVAAGRPRVRAPWLAGLPAALGVDGLSAVFVVTVATVSLLVLVFSWADIPARDARARFFGFLLLFIGSMLVTVTAEGLGVLLFSWELMGATSYALIGYWWREGERVTSANIAFLTTRTADVGLYVAAGAAFAGLQTLDLSRLADVPRPLLHVVAAGLLASAIGKSAQLPMSFWLSRAMSGPSPVSALLHSATMVAAGGYLLLRVAPVLAAAGWAATAALWVGLVTALLLGLVAAAQRDLKQLLAASTCSQLALVVAAAGAGAVVGGTAQFVNHAATKGALFLAAGALLTAFGTKDLTALRGTGRRFPVLGAATAVAFLSLAGVPPLALWASKDEVLAGVLERTPAAYVVGLLVAITGALYSGKALALLFTDRVEQPGGYDTEERGTRRVPALAWAPIAVLAVFAVMLGAVALPAVTDLLRGIIGAQPAGAPRLWQLTLSGLLAVAALAVAFRRPRLLEREVLVGWLGLERAATVLVTRPTLALARALAVMDDRVVDAGVRGTVAAVGSVARLADRQDNLSVDGVVRGVARGARALGRLARRPQTGLVHQYYAQSAAVLAGSLLLLLLVAR